MLGRNLVFQPSDDLVGVGGIHDQPIVRRQPIDQDVIEHAAIRSTHEAVADLVFGKVGYIVCQNAVQEGADAVTSKVENAHVADVKEADRVAHCLVFGNDAFVLNWHFPARKGHNARTCCDVGCIERRALQLHRNPVKRLSDMLTVGLPYLRLFYSVSVLPSTHGDCRPHRPHLWVRGRDFRLACRGEKRE